MILVALHRGRSWISALIRWQTRSVYSHASVVLVNSRESFMTAAEICDDILRRRSAGNPPLGQTIYEAREFSRVCVRYAHPEGEQVDLFRVSGITRHQERLIVEWLGSQVGKPYDYTMVLRFITRRQASRGESGKWFCSELVAAAFQHANLPLLERIEPWAVSPALLSLSPLLVPYAPSVPSQEKESA